MAGMRGTDQKPAAMFSYVSAEERVPPDHQRMVLGEADQPLGGVPQQRLTG